MKFPVFFSTGPFTGDIILNEETSKHVAGVLRMHAGEKIALTDGKGNLYTTEITAVHKKKSTVTILGCEFHEKKKPEHTIAISLLKNTGRFEWFLEKATELGISRIVPLQCERTEKQGFRFERMQQICISAMLQSQQVYMPQLEEPVSLSGYLNRPSVGQKWIAHCMQADQKYKLSQLQPMQPAIFLIGPEGDFSPAEIEMAIMNNYVSVTLGANRLRTETAALVAACWLSLE
jgi:16S rRNA (uracil1498-N3)-methyltransferase